MTTVERRVACGWVAMQGWRRPMALNGTGIEFGNPSTTVLGELVELQLYQRTLQSLANGAASKWAAKKYTASSRAAGTPTPVAYASISTVSPLDGRRSCVHVHPGYEPPICCTKAPTYAHARFTTTPAAITRDCVRTARPRRCHTATRLFRHATLGC
jgi:hypothetical protein